MLLPASILLITVFSLPFVLRQWHVVFYTLAVFLLGVSLYAALQLLRRSRVVNFEHSESLSQDRWRSQTLAVALAALPTFLFSISLGTALPHLSLLLLVCCTAAVGAAISATFMMVVTRALKREPDPCSGPHGGAVAGVSVAAGCGISRVLSATLRPGQGASSLESIPETDAAAQAPLMRAFLQDSLISVEDEKALFAHSASQNGSHGDDDGEGDLTTNLLDEPSSLDPS